jgi:hypothetical protein
MRWKGLLQGGRTRLEARQLICEFSESWSEEAIELFPGKYDTFFTREDGWVERFLRDKSGKVTGILYTHTDVELEAKRLP